MKRLFLFACCLGWFAAAAAVAADAAPAGNLTAAQIVEKNVAARGGLSAWRAINTMTMSGQMDAGGKQDTKLPFVMNLKRPHKSRLEIRFREQTAVQVFDGVQGWKVRPFLGRDDVEPYTPAEAKSASAWEELDGPLVDYVNKGTKVELIGTESVEGKNAYKLKLTMKSGESRHLWVDAASFLEVKIQGEPRRLDGKLRDVAVYYRDYRTVHGLTVAHVLETVVKGVKETHKITIQTVTVNQALADSLFAKPQLAMAKASGR